MRFLALPADQAWLLLASSLIAIVLLYLLKPSPRRLVVASGLIWQRLLRERKRELDRWRWWLSLLLALLIALAMTFALTRPEIAVVGGTAEDHVVVVDNSPSMATRSGDGRTRLQHAIDRAAELIRSAGAGSRFLVVDTMHQLSMAGYVTRENALTQLRTIEAHAGTTPWFPDAGRVVAAASAASDPKAPAANPRRTWLVTDGVAALEAPPGTRVVSVFEAAPNVGITAFEVRAVPADARHHEAFIEVTNAAPAATEVEVSLAGLGAEPVSRRLRVAGNAATGIVLDASRFGEGPLRAHLRAEADAFALDDTAFAYLPAKGRVRLALVTPGNADLARALRLLPRLDVEVLGPGRVRELGRFDAAILDRVTPPQLPTVPALLIAPGRASWLPARTVEVTDTRIERWEATHPLLSGVALRDVLIDRAMSRPGAAIAAAGPDANAGRGAGNGAALPALTAIAQGPGDAALILATQEGPRLAVLGFALDASNFALQPGFPGFLANAVDWLTREPRAAAQRIGPVSLPLTGARVLDIDGNAVTTREVPGATLFDAATPGLYTAVAGDQRVRLAVNLLDPRVTAINAAAGIPGATEFAQVSPAGRVSDPWVMLLLAALALLALEWWTYHRRVTV